MLAPQTMTQNWTCPLVFLFSCKVVTPLSSSISQQLPFDLMMKQMAIKKDQHNVNLKKKIAQGLFGSLMFVSLILSWNCQQLEQKAWGSTGRHFPLPCRRASQKQNKDMILYHCLHLVLQLHHDKHVLEKASRQSTKSCSYNLSRDHSWIRSNNGKVPLLPLYCGPTLLGSFAAPIS